MINVVPQKKNEKNALFVIRKTGSLLGEKAGLLPYTVWRWTIHGLKNLSEKGENAEPVEENEEYFCEI